jgi:hypothetical protein
LQGGCKKYWNGIWQEKITKKHDRGHMDITVLWEILSHRCLFSRRYERKVSQARRRKLSTNPKWKKKFPLTRIKTREVPCMLGKRICIKSWSCHEYSKGVVVIHDNVLLSMKSRLMIQMRWGRLGKRGTIGEVKEISCRKQSGKIFF